MAVRIRMKRLGRRHRPFFRLCAVDGRKPRDGRVIEYLGHYDPMVPETDARAVLKSERIDYWLGVGAQPSDRVRVLIKKYGSNGTHLEQQQAAMERIKASRPVAPPPVVIAKPQAEEPAAEAGDGQVETPAANDATAAAPEAAAESPAETESPAAEASAADEQESKE